MKKHKTGTGDGASLRVDRLRLVTARQGELTVEEKSRTGLTRFVDDLQNRQQLDVKLSSVHEGGSQSMLPVRVSGVTHVRMGLVRQVTELDAAQRVTLGQTTAALGETVGVAVADALQLRISFGVRALAGLAANDLAVDELEVIVDQNATAAATFFVQSVDERDGVLAGVAHQLVEVEERFVGVGIDQARDVGVGVDLGAAVAVFVVAHDVEHVQAARQHDDLVHDATCLVEFRLGVGHNARGLGPARETEHVSGVADDDDDVRLEFGQPFLDLPADLLVVGRNVPVRDDGDASAIGKVEVDDAGVGQVPEGLVLVELLDLGDQLLVNVVDVESAAFGQLGDDSIETTLHAGAVVSSSRGHLDVFRTCHGETP
jgi:hypothetical protein